MKFIYYFFSSLFKFVISGRDVTRSAFSVTCSLPHDLVSYNQMARVVLPSRHRTCLLCSSRTYK